MEVYQKLDGYVYEYMMNIYIYIYIYIHIRRKYGRKVDSISSQQRTVTNYIEKEKNEPFPKTQAFRFISTVESITKVRL